MACPLFDSHARYLFIPVWVGVEQIVKMLQEATAQKAAYQEAKAQDLGDE
jgi:hypothetical protein